jgi:hypothetical protein
MTTGDFTIVTVETDWQQMFALLPRRTISNNWVWMRQIFWRRVWKSNGFPPEPYIEYADIFDVLAAEQIKEYHD